MGRGYEGGLPQQHALRKRHIGCYFTFTNLCSTDLIKEITPVLLKSPVPSNLGGWGIIVIATLPDETSSAVVG